MILSPRLRVSHSSISRQRKGRVIKFVAEFNSRIISFRIGYYPSSHKVVNYRSSAIVREYVNKSFTSRRYGDIPGAIRASSESGSPDAPECMDCNRRGSCPWVDYTDCLEWRVNYWSTPTFNFDREQGRVID